MGLIVTCLNRTCYDCKEPKVLSEFGIDNSGPLGRAYICKVCKSSYRKNHYVENKEVINITNNSWYDRNKQKRLIKGKEWFAANPDSKNAIMRHWKTLGNIKNLRWLHKTENQIKLDKPTPEAVVMCTKLLGRNWI